MEEMNEITLNPLTGPRTISFKAPLGNRKIEVSHTVRVALAQEVNEREQLQPYRSKDIGNDEEEVLINSSPTADINLYNKIILQTRGYKLNVEPQQSPEERRAALENIPTRHKRAVIKKVTAVESEVVYDDTVSEESDGSVNEQDFDWSESQIYRVRTEIDDSVIYTNFKDLSERQFELYSGATRFVLEKGQRKPITKITVSIQPALDVFSSRVTSIEYDGEPFNLSSDEKERAQQIAGLDPYYRRSVVLAVVKETEVDLGE